MFVSGWVNFPRVNFYGVIFLGMIGGQVPKRFFSVGAFSGVNFTRRGHVGCGVSEKLVRVGVWISVKDLHVGYDLSNSG